MLRADNLPPLLPSIGVCPSGIFHAGLSGGGSTPKNAKFVEYAVFHQSNARESRSELQFCQHILPSPRKPAATYNQYGTAARHSRVEQCMTHHRVRMHCQVRTLMRVPCCLAATMSPAPNSPAVLFGLHNSTSAHHTSTTVSRGTNEWAR